MDDKPTKCFLFFCGRQLPRGEMIPSARTHDYPSTGYFCSVRCMNEFETQLAHFPSYISDCRRTLVRKALGRTSVD